MVVEKLETSRCTEEYGSDLPRYRNDKLVKVIRQKIEFFQIQSMEIKPRIGPILI